MASRLMSTRARTQLWRLQEAVRACAAKRDELMRRCEAARLVLMPEALRELWMEFCLAEQEYRIAIANLDEFCTRHSNAVAPENFDPEPAG
jgi:hypothetical protein